MFSDALLIRLRHGRHGCLLNILTYFPVIDSHTCGLLIHHDLSFFSATGTGLLNNNNRQHPTGISASANQHMFYMTGQLLLSEQVLLGTLYQSGSPLLHCDSRNMCLYIQLLFMSHQCHCRKRSGENQLWKLDPVPERLLSKETPAPTPKAAPRKAAAKPTRTQTEKKTSGKAARRTSKNK